ncbi:hypothetical protein FA10DRAFT_269923 [Acaromyces ingoldii]|uniref:Uncharacterized protein n=1 Tax=Acaromyces ingoldii TaxID=215250 RepID=A0A316YDS7_9BASI|nr:hypothetical protein FA10DRAFT_269923 [Acaromyces ingoldii]PWN86818.1 hypothetical protein FA10DRAFT_269923 [Acaromyces ingoldii]
MTSSVSHKDTVPPFKIEHAFTLSEGIDDLIVVGKTAAQERGFINIAEGVLHGSAINARQIFSGGDHVHLGNEGYNMLDARVILNTDDGAIIYVAHDGHLKTNQLTGDILSRKPTGNKKGGWDECRITIKVNLETTAEKYSWINRTLFIARGFDEAAEPYGAYAQFEIFKVY